MKNTILDGIVEICVTGLTIGVIAAIAKSAYDCVNYAAVAIVHRADQAVIAAKEKVENTKTELAAEEAAAVETTEVETASEQ